MTKTRRIFRLMLSNKLPAWYCIKTTAIPKLVARWVSVKAPSDAGFTRLRTGVRESLPA